MYVVYVDDSGDNDHDLLSALAIPMEAWAPSLAAWKGFRLWLAKKHGVTPGMEMHSGEFLKRGSAELMDHQSGQMVKLTEYPWGETRHTRPVAFRKALRTINSFQQHAVAERPVRLFTIYAPTANGKGNLYPPLVDWIEHWLSVEKQWAVLWYDTGDEAKEDSLRAVHRNLDIEQRRIIEDPVARRSHQSHLIQMADVCAHAALKSIRADLGEETRTEVGGAYLELRAIIQPGGFDADGFPASDDPRGIRGWPP
jgi:hypothetical protein